jgi:hypothetical protein
MYVVGFAMALNGKGKRSDGHCCVKANSPGWPGQANAEACAQEQYRARNGRLRAGRRGEEDERRW